jgi:hypothetical protein
MSGNFHLPPLIGGNRLSKVKSVFSIAVQEAAKRENSIPVSLPTIGGKSYHYLSGLLHRDGIALPAREH